MSDLICRKSMMRCQTPGMCSPHGGCQDPVNAQLRAVNFDYEVGKRAADEEIARLKADNEALRKDAERYRWLRNPDQDVANVIDKMVRSGIYEYRAGDELDSSVDAAMSKEAGQ